MGIFCYLPNFGTIIFIKSAVCHFIWENSGTIDEPCYPRYNFCMFLIFSLISGAG